MSTKKSKLRMDFATFYEKHDHYNLTGYINYDLSELFQNLVYSVFPQQLPKNHHYELRDWRDFKNGKWAADSICLNEVSKNFSITKARLDVTSGEFSVLGSTSTSNEGGIINDYFMQLIHDVVSQMEQYYQDHGIEQHGKINFPDDLADLTA